MSIPEIGYCPGTLAEGFQTYSPQCLRRMFKGKKVSHLLPFPPPSHSGAMENIFRKNQQRISISGVQEKFSLRLNKNKLVLTEEGELGEFILKPAPTTGRKVELMPANEHLTMQIARQVFKIDTAENALVFFANGEMGYLTRRFDRYNDGTRKAQEDFASLAGKTPQTHGTNYKYTGSYWDLFQLMKKHVPAYLIEAPKLFRLLVFNYIFSNGDAHLKNFSVISTSWGDYRLSPAYDLLNSHIHIDDSDFALEDGLLPPNLGQGNVRFQFEKLAELAQIPDEVVDHTFASFHTGINGVKELIDASFVDDHTKRNYWQAFQYKVKRFTRE